MLALAGLALTPLMRHQLSLGHAEWIGGHSLAHRVWEAGATFMIGETGDIIARPESPLPALAPLILAVLLLALVFVRGERDERRAASIPLALAAATIVVPLALAIVAPAKDYVLGRNLMPALVPLLAAVAVGATLRRAPRAGLALGAALVAYSLGFCIAASVSPSLQRPDWDAVAERLGEPTAPRALVSWTLGQASLRYYLRSGSFQTFQKNACPGSPRSRLHLRRPGAARAAQTARARLPRRSSYGPVGRLYLRRYALPGPELARLRLRQVREADLGFHSNGVLIDGVGPG